MEKKKEEKGLEEKIINKIQPAIDTIMQRFMGLRIHELGSDISTKLTKNPLLGFSIDANLPYRNAKKKFRKEYLVKLLLKTYGNVSEVARIAQIERRSIHRFIIETRLNVQKMREEMLRPEYIKEAAISKELISTLKEYENVLHPEKMRKIYDDVPEISKDILKELPDEPLTLREAETEFSRQYFKTLQSECKTIKEIAKRSQLRYESVHRKMKALGLI
ncbi:MAG: hypothetical protein ABIJ21_03680 [Nanoarchaeota archaeon]